MALYQVKSTRTGHVYAKDAATGAPLGFLPLNAPGTVPGAYRLPVARELVRLVKRHHQDAILVKLS